MMVRFRMFKINVEQFAILADKLPEVGEDLTFDTRLRFKVAKDHKIAPIIKFTFEKEKSPILLIEVSCEFDIHPDDWKKMLKKGKVEVTKETLEYLSAQTVGVARGILHCKTEGTIFNTFIIPSINVASMIQENISIDVK